MKYLLAWLMLVSVAAAEVTTVYEPITYACDGADTTFNFSFDIDMTDQIVVTVTDDSGTDTRLTETSEYSVTTTNNTFREGPGGTVTTTTAYPSGYTVTIGRVVAKTQERSAAALRREYNILNALDKLTMIVQDLAEPGTDDATALTGLGIDTYWTGPFAEPNAADLFAYWDSFVYHARHYALVGNGSTNDAAALQALSDKIAASSAEGGTIAFGPGVYALASDVTLDPNVSLAFSYGASLAVATGVTIDCNYPSQIIARPRQKVFDLAGTGIVQFSGTDTYEYFLGTVYPGWWGALGNDDHDDTDAIQAAMDAAPDAANGGLSLGLTIEIPWGLYQFSNLSVPGRTVLRGQEIRSTYLERIVGSTGAAIEDKGYAIGIDLMGLDIRGNDCAGDLVKLGVTSNGYSPGGTNQWGWNSVIDRVRVSAADGYGLNLQTNGCTVRSVQSSDCTGNIIRGAATHVTGFHDQSTDGGSATTAGLFLTGYLHNVIGFHGEGYYSESAINCDADGCTFSACNASIGAGHTLPALIYFESNRNDNQCFGLAAYAYEGAPDGIITALVVDDSYGTNRTIVGDVGPGGDRTRFLPAYYAGRQRNIRRAGTTPPAEGSWLRGDIQLNETDNGDPSFWQCTYPGTPGTWSPVGNATGATHLTSDYHIDAATDNGKRFDNRGASGTVTVTLCPDAGNLEFEFVAIEAGQVLRIDPNDGTDYFLPDGGGGDYMDLSHGELVRIGRINPNEWCILRHVGTHEVVDTAYPTGWNGDDVNAPSRNAVYDALSGLGGGHDVVTFDPNAAAMFYLSSGQVIEVNLASPTNGRTDAIATSDAIYDWGVAAFQPLDSDLTIYAGITPSANVQTFLNYADFDAMQAGLAIDDLVSLSGIAEGTAHLGTFTGDTLSDSTTVKTALQELETAVESTSSGDITAVGPGFASGAAFTDGVVSTGTNMFVWEGTTDDGNELILAAPSADPGADITITLPSATGTLLNSDGDGSSLTSVDAATGDSATDFFDAGEIADDRIADTITASNYLPLAGGTVSGEINSNTDITLGLDADNNGSNKLSILDGADAEVASIVEAGTLYLAGNIELGHATDTTIAKSGAGAVTVEGTAVVLAGSASHDGFSDFVANEHIDWTGDQGATDIHSGNIPDLSATYEVQLTNEAGLYAVLSDVTQFYEAGDEDAIAALFSEGAYANSTVVSADIKDGEVAAGDMAATLDLSSKTITLPSRTAGHDNHWRVNIQNPNGQYNNVTTLCLEKSLPAAITVTNIEVTCNAADIDVAIDLKWADAYIGLANAAVIDELDTTSGVASIAAGFDDADVASGKCVYLEWQAEPSASCEEVFIDVTYDYD